MDEEPRDMHGPTRGFGPTSAFLVALVCGCTYGPPEDRAVAHTLRVPDSRTFFAAVQHERFRSPTGINTFPNGGVPKTLRREVRVYRAHADPGNAELWANLDAPREIRSGFSADPVGAAPDTFYVQLSGCPDAECWGDLREHRLYRVTRDGAAPDDAVPDRHRPGGTMAAPETGETHYMRMAGTHHGSVTARLEYPGGDPQRIASRPASSIPAVIPKG